MRGVVLKPSAVVLSGSQYSCTRPATVRLEEVRERTPEWRTRISEGLSENSARWAILRQQMFVRLRAAASTAAAIHGTDCVVAAGDIQDARGLVVVDLTAAVIAALR